ncbi:MAG: hypothetical protein HZB33_15685 [Nitrospirae bacterium]|nr:hypothetical protein [Nitrospirota bacterium]
MAQSWYEDLPDDAFTSEADRQYMLEINRIREGLSRGLGFEEAAAAVEEKDEGLRGLILEDALKIILAGEHFTKGVTLEDLSKRLKLPVERLESVKNSMLDEIAGQESGGQFFGGMEH